jgi:GWxTD domain-containing protein
VALPRPEVVLPAGTYRVSVTLPDSASGRRLSAEGSIKSLRTAEPVSDLLLEPQPGPSGPLAYYLELYSPARSVPGRFWLRVEDSSGEVRWFGPPQHVDPFFGVAPHRGSLDLEPLGPGGYRLVATAEFEGQRETRAVPFDISGPVRTPAAAPLRDLFAVAPEAALDSMYGPLTYIMSPPEQGLYPVLQLRERRAFLRSFWGQRDPTPGTPRNEALEDYSERVKDVNRRFGEGGAVAVPGWRTDRGRIYLRQGPPDLVLRRPPGLRTAGYEVWKYSRGTSRKYIFLDLTRFGNYTLIWSNDSAEPRHANWLALLGAEAAEDAVRF